MSPPAAQGLQTVNTLSYTAQMVESSRADKEKAAFNEVRMHLHLHLHCTPLVTAVTAVTGDQVERWTGARVVAWATELDGGKYAHVAHCFARRCMPPRLRPL